MLSNTYKSVEKWLIDLAKLSIFNFTPKVDPDYAAREHGLRVCDHLSMHGLDKSFECLFVVL